MDTPAAFPTTILFVEDDGPLRTVLCDLLRDWAGPTMHCVDVDSVPRALEVLQSLPVDLIILDYRIAGHSGANTVTALRQACPTDQPMPPIDIISGNISDWEGLAAIRRGADSYLQKGDKFGQAFLSMVQKSWERRQHDWTTWQALQRLEGRR